MKVNSVSELYSICYVSLLKRIQGKIKVDFKVFCVPILLILGYKNSLVKKCIECVF